MNLILSREQLSKFIEEPKTIKQFENLSSEVMRLSSDLSTLSEEVDDLSSDLNTVTADLNTVTADLNTVSSKVDDLEAKDALRITKVLWSGALSTTGVVTNLNVGESFDDWDNLLIEFNLYNNTTTSGTTSNVAPQERGTVRLYSDSGYIVFKRESDTTFSLVAKTMSAANVNRITGIKI